MAAQAAAQPLGADGPSVNPSGVGSSGGRRGPGGDEDDEGGGGGGIDDDLQARLNNLRKQ